MQTALEDQISTLNFQIHHVETSFDNLTKTIASTQTSLEQPQVILNEI